jgi:DNA polymerase III alpha subunit
MKTKYNNNLSDKEVLKSLAFKGLDEKIDSLRNLSNMYQDVIDGEHKKEKYQGYILRELSTLELIKFDGYILMLKEIIDYVKQTDIFIESFGSVQNSLVAYLIGLTSNYEFKKIGDFINFLPFTKHPTFYIVVQSNRKFEVMDFIQYKFKEFIKSSTDDTIQFKEPLEIKFIDLDIGITNNLSKDEAINLGFEVLEPNINISVKNSQLSKQNKILLGFDSLELGDVLIYRILMARDEDGYKPFKSIDDLKRRVPIINDIDKKTQKIVFDNLQINLDKTAKLKEDLKKHKDEL